MDERKNQFDEQRSSAEIYQGFREWMAQFDDKRRSMLSGPEALVAQEAWCAAWAKATKK